MDRRSSPALSSDRLHIVIVDDEPPVLRGLRRALLAERPEWRITSCGSAKEALRVLEAGDCDAMVTDLSMPEMNGVELLEIVAARYPTVVRLVHSGHVGMIDVSMANVAAVLTKPARGGEIVAAIEHALGGGVERAAG